MKMDSKGKKKHILVFSILFVSLFFMISFLNCKLKISYSLNNYLEEYNHDLKEIKSQLSFLQIINNYNKPIDNILIQIKQNIVSVRSMHDDKINKVDENLIVINILPEHSTIELLIRTKNKIGENDILVTSGGNIIDNNENETLKNIFSTFPIFFLIAIPFGLYFLIKDNSRKHLLKNSNKLIRKYNFYEKKIISFEINQKKIIKFEDEQYSNNQVEIIITKLESLFDANNTFDIHVEINCFGDVFYSDGVKKIEKEYKLRCSNNIIDDDEYIMIYHVDYLNRLELIHINPKSVDRDNNIELQIKCWRIRSDNSSSIS